MTLCDYLFDIKVKYHDEEDERPIIRGVDYREAYAIAKFLLLERKNHFEFKQPQTHYVDYVKIE